MGRLILLVLLAVLIAWALNRLVGSREPVRATDDGGIAAPSTKSDLVTVGSGAFMALVSASLFVIEDKGWPAAVMALVGVAGTAFATFSLSKRYVVRWDALSITGPSGWTGPTRQATIR